MKIKNKRSKWFHPAAYLKSVLLVVFITFAGDLGKHFLFPTNFLIFYLLGVVFVSVRWGRGPGVLASILSAAAHDFFLIQPYFQFSLDLRHFFAFTGVLAVGLIVGALSIKIKEQAVQMRLQESRTAALKLQAALLHSISHDLRTPLATITGSLSALMENGALLDQDKKQELVENAFEESSRLNRIVENLLDSTRLEAGALKVLPEPCELRDVIGVSLQELKFKLQDRPVEIQVPRDFPEIPMDFALIAKVMMNLIDNALKYSPEGTPLHIRAKAEKDGARIEISDQGGGIKEKDLDKVFEKFYRADKAEKISGLGLGLWICKGIIEAHHGEIRALSPSPEGSGTTVFFKLPLKGNDHERK